MNSELSQNVKAFSRLIILIGIIGSIFIAFRFGHATPTSIDEFLNYNEAAYDIGKIALILSCGIFTTFLLSVPIRCLGEIAGKLHDIDVSINDISEDVADLKNKDDFQDSVPEDELSNLISNLSDAEKIKLFNQLKK